MIFWRINVTSACSGSKTPTSFGREKIQKQKTSSTVNIKKLLKLVYYVNEFEHHAYTANVLLYITNLFFGGMNNIKSGRHF